MKVEITCVGLELCYTCYKQILMRVYVLCLMMLSWSVSSAQSIQELKGKAYLGNHTAEYNLALSFYYGENETMNIDSALYWFEQAAEGGIAYAQYNLGVIYHQGIHVERNESEAEKWYIMAAHQDMVDAQFALGMLYYGDDCSTYGCANSIPWIEAAAEQGHNGARNLLGNIYLSGEEGMTIDYQKALKWYRLAAKDGFAEAQFNLGWMYYYGRGVTKNNSIAVMWLKMAADQGNVKAMEFIEANRMERYL